MATLALLNGNAQHRATVLCDMPTNQTLDVTSLRTYLVAMRGRLHHVSRKSRGLHPTLDQNVYETAAFVAMCIARYSD